MALEGLPFFDAMYMTVMTVATVGYGDIVPRTVAGRAFTMLLVVTGVGMTYYTLTALFALARTVGWIAQWKEMLEDPHQKIGRPRQIYTGPTERAYTPMAKRK